MGPFNSQAGSQMSYGSFGSVVRCLRLRDVDDCPGHAPNEHHAPLCIPLHQMSSHSNGKIISSVDIDAPKLVHSVRRIVDGVVILGEASRGDQMINLSVISEDFFEGIVDGLDIRDIGKVG
jgi:hypothetical protein